MLPCLENPADEPSHETSSPELPSAEPSSEPSEAQSSTWSSEASDARSAASSRRSSSSSKTALWRHMAVWWSCCGETVGCSGSLTVGGGVGLGSQSGGRSGSSRIGSRRDGWVCSGAGHTMRPPMYSLTSPDSGVRLVASGSWSTEAVGGRLPELFCFEDSLDPVMSIGFEDCERRLPVSITLSPWRIWKLMESEKRILARAAKYARPFRTGRVRSATSVTSYGSSGGMQRLRDVTPGAEPRGFKSGSFGLAKLSALARGRTRNFNVVWRTFLVKNSASSSYGT
mmetsp:Transcript_21215/g.36442  ORF Transcript_21215/g.36442 Transcript_21215/m.36442 type:complete len:284 (+) Transcript_21215:657-1508(+)